MPEDRSPTPGERSVHHVYYGLNPRPIAISLPPVEATSEQPLPDAGPFLRVCAGVEQPGTAMLRCTGELVGVWRYVHDHGRPNPQDTARVDEQLNLAVWLIDREAGGHTKGMVVRDDAPTNPSSYGQWVAWLVWKYVLYVLRRDDPDHAERDATELMVCTSVFDHLVADVRAGRVRLPLEATETEVFPPKAVSPRSDDTDGEPRQ
ncbi:hypothetical protein [Nocardia brasiliensis]|uniref:hypothetical protein n=1 Tax=Nocardia brasiliensis TaxID=37326 RepID=UPI002455A54C|nr:hypothetical protein [Nocardia brasiliensis]